MVCFACLAFGLVPKFKIKRGWVIALIIFVAGLNITSHFIFAAKYDMDPNRYFIAVVDEDISSSHFAHTHTFKPIIVAAMKLVGSNPMKIKGDPGFPYYELQPRWIANMGLIAVVFLVLSLLLFLLQDHQKWARHQQMPFVFIYTIVSFAVLKSSVDGGPLWSEYIIFCSALLAILIDQNYSFKPISIKFFIIALIYVTVATSIYFLWGTQKEYIYQSRRMLSSFVFLITFASLFLVVFNRNRFLIPILIIGILSCIYLIKYSYWIQRYTLLNMPLEKGDKVYFLNEYDLKIPFETTYNYMCFTRGMKRKYGIFLGNSERPPDLNMFKFIKEHVMRTQEFLG